jgi:iron complex transport system substrate-binding protein
VKYTLLLFLCWSLIVFADITVVDDAETMIVLAEPASKIVSLSPHLTELLFSLGAGDRIKATVEFSDYPEAALKIPRLGNAFSVSVEAVIEQSPDLIVAWMTGGNQRTFEQLRSLGYPVFVNEASALGGIAAAVQQLGTLVGKPGRGLELAKKFRVDLERLRQLRSGLGSPKVFFRYRTLNSRQSIVNTLLVRRLRSVVLRTFFPMSSFSFQWFPMRA